MISGYGPPLIGYSIDSVRSRVRCASWIVAAGKTPNASLPALALLPVLFSNVAGVFCWALFDAHPSASRRAASVEIRLISGSPRKTICKTRRGVARTSAGMRRNSNILLGAMTALTAAVHLVCINQYGVFRDELYFLACGEHLDWGYVDQPPLVAVYAWIARHLGTSLLAVRILPVLAAAALVALTGAMARRLGGRLLAQFLACLTLLIAPFYLAVGHFLSMNITEPLFWMAMVYVAIAIFQGGDERLWLL